MTKPKVVGSTSYSVPFVFDEGAVGEQGQAAFEVDVFALGVAFALAFRSSCGQFAFGAGFERAGEADVDVAAFVAFGVDAEREVEVAALHPFEASRFRRPSAGLRCCLSLPPPQAAKTLASAARVANRTKMRIRLKRWGSS